MSELNEHRLEQPTNRGRLEDEYKIYRDHADDGKGGDITNGGKPLKTYEQWLAD